MYAIKTRNKAIVQALIQNGGDINRTNIQQKTALFYVAKYGTPELAKLLIDNGARLQLKDRKGRTPLEYAVANKNIPVARYFKSLE